MAKFGLFEGSMGPHQYNLVHTSVAVKTGTQTV
jgi:hypothetical protein